MAIEERNIARRCAVTGLGVNLRLRRFCAVCRELYEGTVAPLGG
jgi:hypothetical protein